MSGITYLLERVRGTSDPVVYRGGLDGAITCRIEVRLSQSSESVDGFVAEVEVSDAPADKRTVIERTAGVMVKSAVRRALKDGRPPPRRIQRWRQGC